MSISVKYALLIVMCTASSISMANPFTGMPDNNSAYPRLIQAYPQAQYPSAYPQTSQSYPSMYPQHPQAPVVQASQPYYQQPNQQYQAQANYTRPQFVPAQAQSRPALLTTTTTSYQSTSLNPSDYPLGKPTMTCVANIAASQGLPLDLMLGIQSVERGLTGQTVGNKNATYDIGAFQINSIHLRRVASLGGSEYDLLHRGCYNARIAAMLLSEALNNPKKQGMNFYSRAAGYHSWTPSYNGIYRRKLVKYTAQWQDWLRVNNMGHLVTAPPAY